MKIKFLGVGEAFDNILSNNSQLFTSDSVNILLDCGYSVPQQWFRLGKDADFLDAIWISHQHADHYFGLPAVLMRMWEEGRTKPLTVFCQKERVQFLSGLMELAYPGFSEKFNYKIEFLGMETGKQVDFMGLK